MKKYHVILLAGGEKGPLFERTGFVEKALIPIHGIPMLSRVIEAFHQAERADEIVVVGSSNLDQLESMCRVRKRIAPGFNVIQNLVHAITLKMDARRSFIDDMLARVLPQACNGSCRQLGIMGVIGNMIVL